MRVKWERAKLRKMKVNWVRAKLRKMKVNWARAKLRSDVFTSIAQIAALVVAAWWTFATYKENFFPETQLRIKIDSDLKLSSFRPGLCQADFSIHLENLSKRSFSVGSVLWRASRLDLKNTRDGTHLGPEEFLSSGQEFDSRCADNGLVGYYPLNYSNDAASTWIVNQDPDTAVGFRADFFQEQNCKGETLDWQMQWRVARCDATAAPKNGDQRHSEKQK